MTTLTQRLRYNKEVFAMDQHYVDCELISGDKTFRCQRLFLAVNCTWFENYFKEHNEPFREADGRKTHIQRITLPVDPDDRFGDVLKLLYTGEGRIDAQTIPPFLKIADFYGIENIRNALRLMYKEPIIADSANENNVIHFAKEFIKLGLIADAQLLAPTIAIHFTELLLNPYTPTTLLTKERIYEALSPQVFAAVLNDPTLRSKAIPNDEVIVKLIDEYVECRKERVTDIEDQKALAACIKWDTKNAYQYLISNKCEWLPTAIARPLLRQIIYQRRDAAQQFATDAAKPTPQISHWYPYVWADKIAKADSKAAKPVVEIVKFVSTLGGLVKRFNPHVFGFLQAFASTQCVNDGLYNPRFLFEEEGEFVSMPRGQEVEPMIGFDLGPAAHFVPSTCILNCDVRRRNVNSESQMNIRQPGVAAPSSPVKNKDRFRFAQPVNVAVCGVLGDPKEFKGKSGIIRQQCRCPEELIKRLSLKEPHPMRTLAVQLVGNNNKGGRVLALKELEFEGFFAM